MYRLVTIDVALPTSFGAKEPGLGNVCLSISVHVYFPYHLEFRLKWLCVFCTRRYENEDSNIASAFEYLSFTKI